MISNTSATITIRIATIADVEAITSVINKAFAQAERSFIDSDRIDGKQVSDFLKSGKFFLAESGNILLGCVYIEKRGDRAYLGLLSVNPDTQQYGVGSLLMDIGENDARSQGCRYMDLSVVNLRKELVRYYKRRGYVETGTGAFPAEVKTKVPVHFINMSKEISNQ